MYKMGQFFMQAVIERMFGSIFVKKYKRLEGYTEF
jgi:hypothetical protein